MLYQLFHTIIVYSALALLCPLLISILRFKTFTPSLKVLTFHLVLVSSVEIIANLMWYYRMNNLKLLHVYTVLEFIMISWFYSICLKDMVRPRIIFFMAAGFTLFSVFNSWQLQPVTEFNTYARSLESILVIIYALASFFYMLTRPNLEGMVRTPLFWINSGFLIYFSGGLFLFILSNYIVDMGKDLNRLGWGVHAILSIVLYIFISIGLWNSRAK
jgi:hypothetical protein